MKRLLTTAAVLIALADVSGAQPALTTQMGQQLVYKTQAIRDRIGVLCQRLPSGHQKGQRDECEGSVYTTYYGIVASIRMAERGGDEQLQLISKKIDEFEATVAPLMRDLERR